MGYIYLITNKINNKKYVGKTTKSIKERWEEHLKDSKKEKCEIRPLYRAIRKYGIENFTIEEIEKCNIISLYASEVARVLGCCKDSVYKILKANDIPIYSAGDVTKEKTSKKVAQYDKNGNFIKGYPSYSDAELAMGNTQRHICDVANGKRKSAYGFIWRWID